MKGFRLTSSLRQQIILSSLVCLIIPFAIILYLSNLFTKDLIEKQAVTNAEESLKLVKTQLYSQIEGMFSVANNIQIDSQLTPYLKIPTYTSSENYVTDKLHSLTHDKSGVFVTVLTTDKRFFSNYLLYKDFNPLQFMEEPWFSKLYQLGAYENYWLGFHRNYLDIEKNTDPYVITFVRTLRTSLIKPYAYVIISISENRMRSVFSSYTEQNIMLLDRNGTIISGKENLGESFPYYQELLKPIDRPIIDINGVPNLYATAKLPFDDWTLVSLMPYNQATKSINQFYQANFLWQIGFVAVFVGILVWMLRRFTQPVVRLGQVVSSIESGNLSIRSEVRGSNEIGKLGRSLDQMLDRIEQMVIQIHGEQEQARKAELSMLQAQISPHFLFNILNSIRMRIMLNGDRENADLISSLSQLLRMTIQKQDKMVTLSEEVVIAKQYMDLMKSTLKEPFHDQILIAEETGNVWVPRFLLQPIIENALLHGLQNRAGIITIESAIRNERLIVRVQDDGSGMTQDELGLLMNKLEKSKSELIAESSSGMSGIGLANVYNRLFMLFGNQCTMQIESELDQGTVVSVSIPLIRGLPS
ncbi:MULTISPECIES: sensor histidine kinase [unclassified Paenibacillus]|uniref:cache domain-containing sensor histidine kinase n=1 Tax=unclassified Paenibacillus TaxID=185978 RepID=UPI002788C95E|nr:MULTISPECIES: sensor histidine kinase [unclassified Paenibacillus]MDQ0902085.1 two-component system sensor histidine kinase YesM [Paenibacillus sp. V4I7]MDQ0919421.1 two-component system sensor histidine kinase YesM [Paenibacillus sp. V4I5]